MVICWASIVAGIVMARPPAGDDVSAPVCTGPSTMHHVCVSEQYGDLVDGAGADAALAAPPEQSLGDAARCHQLAHEIGRAAAHRYGTVAAAYRHGDRRCGGGYHHGVLEGVLVAAAAEGPMPHLDTFCGELRAAEPFGQDHLNCGHGLGHGVLAVLGGDLHGALAACDTLTEEREREACYSGVFMQNQMALHDLRVPAPHLDPDRPLYPCTEVATRHRSQCYQRQTTYALALFGDDFTTVFDLCRALEPAARTACHQGLGRDAAQQALVLAGPAPARHDHTSRRCALAPGPDAESACRAGAVTALVRYFGHGAEAEAFCATLAAALRSGCAQAVVAAVRKPES